MLQELLVRMTLFNDGTVVLDSRMHPRQLQGWQQTWGNDQQDQRQDDHLDGPQHTGRMGWHDLKAQQGWSQVFHSGEDSPMAQHGLDASWLSRKTPMVQVNRLAASHLCAPTETKANHTPGCIGKIIASRPRKGIIWLYSVLLKLPRDSIQKRDPEKQSGTSPKEWLPRQSGAWST